MRLFRRFVLGSCCWALTLTFAGNGAMAFEQPIRPPFPSKPRLALETAFVCGTFDGHFTCRNDFGAGAQFGKNASPGARAPNSAETPPTDLPGGTWQGTAIPADTGQGVPQQVPNTGSTCQHGMVGTPPDCRCPKNSELLGGNCVHYTASACNSGLASRAQPQACRGVEEKLSCTLRQDGLKDCCCVIYDKF
jgi:hypothetical protein